MIYNHNSQCQLATETAINIGYSSKLLVEDMRVFIINAEDKAGVKRQLNEAKYVVLLVRIMLFCHTYDVAMRFCFNLEMK